MAAAAVPLRAMFARLGASVNASTALTDVQGIDDLEELGRSSEAEIKALCDNVRKPGGGAGIPLSATFQKRLLMAVYHVKHAKRVSRALTVNHITLARIDNARIRFRQTLEVAHKPPDAADRPQISEKDWPKFFEQCLSYMNQLHGTSGTPLGYVIRPDEAVPLSATDPTANYYRIEDEMIARAPMLDANGDETPEFQYDNATFFNELELMVGPTEHVTHIKAFKRDKDGRGAYLALFDNKLGPNNAQTTAAKTETEMRALEYRGETRNNSFDNYSTSHKKAFTTLEGLEDYGYHGLDPGTRVRMLMAGIKSTDLDVVKAQILSDPAACVNFDRCVMLYKNFLSMRASTSIGTDRRHASEMNSDSFSMRYYTRDEYRTLSDDQKDQIREWRDAEKAKGKKFPKTTRAKPTDRKGKEQSQLAHKKAKSKIKHQARQISELKRKLGTNDNDADALPPVVEDIENRNNDALRRRRGG